MNNQIHTIVKRILIYLRVSTKGQAHKENPLDAQKTACLEYARKNGYPDVGESDIYIDGGVSGRTDDRSAFRAMTKRLEEDDSVEGVIAYDMSRIFRNGMEYFNYKKRLKKFGKKILSTVEQIIDDGTPNDFMMEWTFAGFNQFRSMEDGRKIKNGMLEKAQNGVLAGKAPFGYINVQEKTSSSKAKRWVEVNEDEAVWVKKVFSMFATGNYSLKRLAGILSKEGFPMRTSKKLYQGFLHRIITNPTYIGKVPYKKEIYDGKHKHIIEEPLFNQVNGILHQRGQGADRSQKHTFPLKGILYCDVCGSKYTGEHKVTKNGSVIRYLRCLKKIKSEKVECDEKYFQEGHIASHFDDLFKTIQLPNCFT